MDNIQTHTDPIFNNYHINHQSSILDISQIQDDDYTQYSLFNETHESETQESETQ